MSQILGCMYATGGGGSFRCIPGKNAYITNGRPCITGNLDTIFPIEIQIFVFKNKYRWISFTLFCSYDTISTSLRIDVFWQDTFMCCTVLWNQCHAETLCLSVI